MGTGAPPKPQWAPFFPQRAQEQRPSSYCSHTSHSHKSLGVDCRTKHNGEATKLTIAAVADTLIGVLLGHILSTLCSSLRGKYPQNGL